MRLDVEEGRAPARSTNSFMALPFQAWAEPSLSRPRGRRHSDQPEALPADPTVAPRSPSAIKNPASISRRRCGQTSTMRRNSKRDRAVAATVASFDVATERCGATDCDVAQRFLLASRERRSECLDISRAVDAENVGQLQR